MQYLLLWNVMLIIFLSGCGPSPQSIIEAYNNGQKDIVWDYIDNGGSVNIADQRPNGTNCTLLMLAIDNKVNLLPFFVFFYKNCQCQKTVENIN